MFPTQGWNPGLLLCRRILYCLSHLGSLLRILNNDVPESSTAWHGNQSRCMGLGRAPWRRVGGQEGCEGIQRDARGFPSSRLVAVETRGNSTQECGEPGPTRSHSKQPLNPIRLPPSALQISGSLLCVQSPPPLHPPWDLGRCVSLSQPS